MRLNYESFRHLYQKPPCIEILDKDEIKRSNKRVLESRKMKYMQSTGPDDLESLK